MTEKKEKKEEKDEKDKAKDEKKEGSDVIDAIFKVNLHCQECGRKIKKHLLVTQGVQNVEMDIEKGEIKAKGKLDPLKILKLIEKWSKKKVELISPKIKVKETPAPVEEKPKEIKEPIIRTITVKVHMHCDKCERDLRNRLIKHKGIFSVKTDQKAQTVTIEGSIEPEKLLRFLKRRVHKNAEIISEEKKGEEKEKGKKEGKSSESTKEKSEGKPGESAREKGEGKSSESKEKEKKGSESGKDKGDSKTGGESTKEKEKEKEKGGESGKDKGDSKSKGESTKEKEKEKEKKEKGSEPGKDKGDSKSKGESTKEKEEEKETKEKEKGSEPGKDKGDSKSSGESTKEKEKEKEKGSESGKDKGDSKSIVESTKEKGEDGKSRGETTQIIEIQGDTKVEIVVKDNVPYIIHYVYAPQLFSDENPNACYIL